MPNAALAASAPLWPKDTTVAKNAFYGDFHGAKWQAQYLTRVTPPFRMFYDKKPIPSLLVNRKIASSLLTVFNEIWNECEHDQKKVDATGASDFGGCFNIRPIAGSNNWSNHSWACAIDLSPGSNGFNMKTTLSRVVIDAFKAEGWRWGGDYKNRRDPMHFEAVRPA
ncbi:MAG: M15 family metallopeptidase [Proteobacteria bacterium]|nr:M15 family metallopeptidase [Pseudomonadota bacterium]